MRNNLPTNNIGESTSDKLIGSKHPLISRHSTPNAWTADFYAFIGYRFIGSASRNSVESRKMQSIVLSIGNTYVIGRKKSAN